jgi:hypothetical protein
MSALLANATLPNPLKSGKIDDDNEITKRRQLSQEGELSASGQLVTL